MKIDLWQLSLDIDQYNRSPKTDNDFNKIYHRVNYLQKRYYNWLTSKYESSLKEQCNLFDYTITAETTLDAIKHYNINKLNSISKPIYFSTYLKTALRNFVHKSVEKTYFITKVDICNEKYLYKFELKQAKEYRTKEAFTSNELETIDELQNKYLLNSVEARVADLLIQYLEESNTDILIMKELKIPRATYYRIKKRIENKMTSKLKCKNNKYQL